MSFNKEKSRNYYLQNFYNFIFLKPQNFFSDFLKMIDFEEIVVKMILIFYEKKIESEKKTEKIFSEFSEEILFFRINFSVFLTKNF